MVSGCQTMLISLVLAGLLGASASRADFEIGSEFPDFQATELLSGEPFKLSEFRGNVVIVDFWATWCGPCLIELPNVKRVFEAHREKGLQIISISLDRSVDRCREFVQKQGMDWYHVADGKWWQAELAVRFGIRSIPAMFVIGKDGKVVASRPRGDDLEPAVRQALEQAYSGPVGARAGKPRPAGGETVLRFAPADPPKPPAKSGAQAEQECEQWLNIARLMEQNKNYRLARHYYRRLIDTYPGTRHAKSAQDALEKLPG